MSQQINNNYSPFNNYFDLADVITSINLPTTISTLNPFATPFIPSVLNFESDTDSDEQSPTECPFLREIVCSQCGATGDDAHSIKYSPINQLTVFFT